MNEAAALLLGRARLRGVLQAARGGHHDPDPARPALGPRRRTASRSRTVRADAFCHNMVRVAGRLPDRRRGGTPRAGLGGGGAARPASATPRCGRAAAHGLTLEEVGYPTRRGPRRPGGGDPQREDGRGWMTTTSPPTPRSRSSGPRSRPRLGHRLELTSGSGRLRPGPARHRHRRAVPRDRAAGAGTDPRPRLRLRRDRPGRRPGRPGRRGDGRRRQRAGAAAGE